MPVFSNQVHTGRVTSVYAGINGGILSSALDGMVTLWDLEKEGQESSQRQLMIDHGCITCCSVDERTKMVIAGGSSGILHISSL